MIEPHAEIRITRARARIKSNNCLATPKPLHRFENVGGDKAMGFILPSIRFKDETFLKSH